MSLLQEHIQTNEQRNLPDAQEVRLHVINHQNGEKDTMTPQSTPSDDK